MESFGYLQAITIEVSHLVALALCPVDLDLHPRADTLTEHPDLRALAHEHDAEVHAEVPLALQTVIKELRIEQVGG